MRVVGLVISMLVAATLACTLTTGGNNPTAVSTSGKPLVSITFPAQNTAFQVGDTITVQAQASDTEGTGITRVELLANNVVVDSQTSENPLGESSLSVLLDYIAAVSNPTLQLTVRAYRGAERSDDAIVTVSVGGGSSTSNTGTNQTSPTQSGFIVPTYNPVCRARVDVGTLNFRSGPSVDYDKLGSFDLSDEVPVVGRLSDNSWWQVSSNGLRGWISAAYSSLLGDCNNIALGVPPPSPTPAATITPSPAPNAPANLIITTLAGDTNFELTGQELVTSYVLRIKNVGGTAAGAFNVTIFAPNQEPRDHTIASLAPGQEETIPNLTAKFTAPGTYRFEVLVDSSGNITESNKNDNRASLDIVVVSPAPTQETSP